MAEETGGLRRHFILDGVTETEAYRPVAGGGVRPVIPERDRAEHSSLLRRQLDVVRAGAEFAREAQRGAGMQDGVGLQVEFEIFPEVDLAFESLARERSGIELLNVRDEDKKTLATVFVPDGKLEHFERLIRDYFTRNRNRADVVRDNRRLVDAIQQIRAASLQALWTDSPELFPNPDEGSVWWEVWLPVRRDRDAVTAAFRHRAGAQGIEVAQGELNFPERTVLMARASVRQMRRSMVTLNSIAELRRPKETTDFFDSLQRDEQKVREELSNREHMTESGMFRRLERHLAATGHIPFEYCVIDEAQDIGVAELRLLSVVVVGDRPNSLFFAGDLGQRIFQTPFSWCALGVDVRGRSQTLRINYRTSHQIRRQADRLLPSEIADVDGVTEQRGGTISAFNGPEPLVRVLGSPEEESVCIAAWLRERREEGYQPQEIGVFVRSEAELDRAIKGIEEAGFSAVALSTRPGGATGSVAVGTMHLAKGLEFRAVVVAGCDDEVLPLQSRIERVVDEADLEEVYNTERHLLYVACTRARDRLLVTGTDPASEFLDDLVPAA